MNDKLAEVIAHLDDFERDLARLTAKIREYRYMLFDVMEEEE